MQFKRKGNYCVLENYTGEEVFLDIPSQWEGLPVKGIEGKAFLSCKSIQNLVVAESVEEIGDWAFAHMKNLKTLTISGQNIKFGKHVFMDCPELLQVFAGADVKEGKSYLLAAGLTVLQREELLTEYTDDWFAFYDACLLAFLEAPDDYGFEPVFFGWFDVEDIDVQAAAYQKMRRKEKLRMVFLRLRYSENMKAEVRDCLEDYLRQHMPQQESDYEDSPLIGLLSKEYKDESEYVKILTNAGCVTEKNVLFLLNKLQQASPEVLGYLLGYQQTLQADMDYFSSLTL